jgi:LysM repeat protein
MGTVLSTGHLYKVDSGDYLNAISFKFGTTLKHLLTLNADLAAGHDNVLAVGTELCVIPNSCIRD